MTKYYRENNQKQGTVAKDKCPKSTNHPSALERTDWYTVKRASIKYGIPERVLYRKIKEGKVRTLSQMPYCYELK